MSKKSEKKNDSDVNKTNDMNKTEQKLEKLEPIFSSSSHGPD